MNDYEPAKQGMTGGQKALIGCGVIALLIVILIAVGIYWAYGVGKEMMGDAFYTLVSQTVEDAELPESQQAGVLREVASLRDELKAGEVDFTQFVLAMQQMMEGTPMKLIALSGVESRHVEPSGLSDDEKAAAGLTIQRFMRGVVEGGISSREAEEAWFAFTEEMRGAYPNQQGMETRELRGRIDDEELREILADLKQVADDAGVPDEPYEPDLAAEMRKSIDRALGR